MIGTTTHRPPVDLGRSLPSPKVRVARAEPSPIALVSLALALLLSGAGGRATTLLRHVVRRQPWDAS